MSKEKVRYRFRRYGELWKMIWLVRRIWVVEPLFAMVSIYQITGSAIECYKEAFGA